MSETAHHADVVLAGSLHEEEDGLGCSAEGRVIHWQKSIDPPGDARRDSDIIIDLAHRLGRGQYFPFKNPADILEELRVASRGGVADYYGITYERVDKEMGIFWPCPSLDHPGTPRLFVDKKFYTHDGKAHFNVTEWRPSGDPVNDEYPFFLTTGRVVSQYLSGTQTRRIGALVDQNPEPRAEIHPRLAEQHGIKDGDWVTVTTRRDDLTIRAHGGEDHSSGHRLHSVSLGWHSQRKPAHPSHSRSPQQDSGIQGFGLPNCSGPMARTRPRMIAARSSTTVHEEAPNVRIRILHRSFALYRLPLVLAGLRGMRDPPGHSR